MTSTQNEAAPESRIGYNNNNLYLPSGYLGTGNRLLNFASESVNDKSTESSTGLGTDDLGAGQNLGYLDYFQNDNAGGLTGLGLRRRLALQRALRRRNGAALGAGGGAGAAAVGGTNDLAGLNSNAVDLTGAGAGLGALGAAGLTGLNDRGSNLLGLGSSGYGSGHSGYGGGYEPVLSGYGLGPSQQCKNGLNPLLTLLTLAIAAAGFYFIYTKLTSITGRKKRDLNLLEILADLVTNGAF